MDKLVDSLTNAYQDFVSAAATVLQSKDAAPGQNTAAADTALENFKQKWELFRVSCDKAEELVESVNQQIGSECLVDEASGSAASISGRSPAVASAGLPPTSAVRLEQMSKAVRWLVIELQQGSSGGGSGGGNSAAADARFSEESGQSRMGRECLVSCSCNFR